MFTLFDAFYDTLINGISKPIANKTQDEILSYIKYITYAETELDKNTVFDILKETDADTPIIQGIEFWSDDFKIETITKGNEYDADVAWTDFIFISIKKPEIKLTCTPEDLSYSMPFTKEDGHITFAPDGEIKEL